MKNVKVRKVGTILAPYQTSESYGEALRREGLANPTLGGAGVYGKDLYEEVYRFSEAARELAEEEEHDVIHAHDWMTYMAGINARETSGKPLVVHIHATEFDRTGGNPNTYISDIECKGLKEADRVVANSNFTKNNVIYNYGIDPDKIDVVHWGIDPDNPAYNIQCGSPFSKTDKVVLFLGRITIQKGPDYFIEMAKRVSDYIDNVKFVIAGSGDMMDRMINRAAELGISDKVLFTGFLKGDDVHKAFQMADVYVMPSVSEPFGLVALEALKNNTPILISKQSGVSEVVSNALKVDFWDIDEMTNKMVSLLTHAPLYEDLRDNSYIEAQKFNLDEPAQKCMLSYYKAIRGDA